MCKRPQIDDDILLPYSTVSAGTLVSLVSLLPINMLLSRLTCSLLLYFSVLCSTLASGYCGDGICETPELADSCPTDCGEVVRNPRLFGQAPTPPYFWALDPPDASVTYLNHTGPETEQKSLAVQLPGSAAVTQTLALIPGHHYSLRMVTDPPASECWRGFVYTSAEVLADTVGHNEFIAPESGATGGVFVGARATPTCQSAAGLSSISVISLPNNANFGFHYPAVYETFLGDPHRGVSPKECRQMCLNEPSCCAWQVCPGTEEEGCGGCYLLGRRPSDGAVERKEGWYAGVERLVPAVRGGDGDGMDAEACRAWLLEQSAHDEDFYNEKSGKLYKYHDCGWHRDISALQVPKQVFVGGAHYPTIVVANHRTPEPKMPSEKHDPTAILPHFFALPFYDTNIGNMIKNTGCMNVLQSYEMQSILKPGDVFIDAGANLGSYTIPIAEHLGPAGMVLAFEPFRWTYQLLNANVALNGLMNVWTYQAALSDTAGQSLLLQPQLRFFSSPGGVRANPTNQTGGLSEEDSKQLYDTEWGAEAVEAVRLDDIIFDSNLFAGRNREPTVSLIKIDVEGMEVNVMRGALRTLETFHPIVWSENVDYFEKEDLSFIALMDSLDYTCAKASAAPTDLVCQDKYGRGPTPIALTEA